MMYSNRYLVTILDKTNGVKTTREVDTKDSYQAHKMVHDDINWQCEEITEIFYVGKKKNELAYDNRRGFLEKVS